MTNLDDLLPPPEAHLVRTVLAGVKACCLEHGETTEQAQDHAADDATTWVRDLLNGTLALVDVESLQERLLRLAKPEPVFEPEYHEQLTMGRTG